jgi:hypothetical protein
MAFTMRGMMKDQPAAGSRMKMYRGAAMHHATRGRIGVAGKAWHGGVDFTTSPLSLSPEGVMALVLPGRPLTVRFQDPQFADLRAQWQRVPASSHGTLLAFTGMPIAQLRTGAEAFARTLGKPLQAAAGLGPVRSPFIGETEKNLSRVFARAAASGAILLFDEADALFGKRSGVQSAHDKYANLEVSHLHQQLATHRGLVIALFSSAVEAGRVRQGVRQVVVTFPP